jgi:hypothetical protein
MQKFSPSNVYFNTHKEGCPSVCQHISSLKIMSVISTKFKIGLTLKVVTQCNFGLYWLNLTAILKLESNRTL